MTLEEKALLAGGRLFSIFLHFKIPTKYDLIVMCVKVVRNNSCLLHLKWDINNNNISVIKTKSILQSKTPNVIHAYRLNPMKCTVSWLPSFFRRYRSLPHQSRLRVLKFRLKARQWVFVHQSFIFGRDFGCITFKS